MAAAAAEHELAPGFREAMSLLATGVVLVGNDGECVLLGLDGAAPTARVACA
jgi:hypothetical protein